MVFVNGTHDYERHCILGGFGWVVGHLYCDNHTFAGSGLCIPSSRCLCHRGCVQISPEKTYEISASNSGGKACSSWRLRSEEATRNHLVAPRPHAKTLQYKYIRDSCLRLSSLGSRICGFCVDFLLTPLKRGAPKAGRFLWWHLGHGGDDPGSATSEGPRGSEPFREGEGRFGLEYSHQWMGDEQDPASIAVFLLFPLVLTHGRDFCPKPNDRHCIRVVARRFCWSRDATCVGFC